jgi:hypothetical protein
VNSETRLVNVPNLPIFAVRSEWCFVVVAAGVMAGLTIPVNQRAEHFALLREKTPQTRSFAAAETALTKLREPKPPTGS